MVGLSVILETQNCCDFNNKTPQIINKSIINNNNKTPSSPSLVLLSNSNHFLHHCFLCRHNLLPGKDIYMYKGDKGFCSEECRSRQIFLDDEESKTKGKCSMAAMKPTTYCVASSSSTSVSHRRNKGNRNRAGGFAF